MQLSAPVIPEYYELETPEQMAALASTANVGSCIRSPQPQRIPLKNHTTEMMLARFPRLIAHMICESLGYYTPQSAALALREIAQGRPSWSEMMMHFTEGHITQLLADGKIRRNLEGYITREDYEAAMIDTGRRFLADTLKHRKHHTGFMSSYSNARAIINYSQTPTGKNDIGLAFMSW